MEMCEKVKSTTRSGLYQCAFSSVLKLTLRRWLSAPSCGPSLTAVVDFEMFVDGEQFSNAVRRLSTGDDRRRGGGCDSTDASSRGATVDGEGGLGGRAAAACSAVLGGATDRIRFDDDSTVVSHADSAKAAARSVSLLKRCQPAKTAATAG